jgi:hypothetical protein
MDIVVHVMRLHRYDNTKIFGFNEEITFFEISFA